MIKTARYFPSIWLLAALGLLLGPPPLHAEGTYAYSTYLGGTSWEWGEAITTTPSGNVYLAAITNSDNFLQLRESPAGPPPYNSQYEFVTVVGLDSTGRLLYWTRIFGVYPGRAIFVGGIAAAPDGSVMVVGTLVMDDPRTYAFYARLSPSGQMISSGFPGGIWPGG